MRCIAALCAAALLAGCTAALTPPVAPSVPPATVATPPDLDPDDGPEGAVTVAHPDALGTWWQASVEDLAAADLASIWALPLFRVDPLGRWVPALALDWRVIDAPGGWTIEVDLRPGSWSDGEPVTADDIVATAEALAIARPTAWAAWTGATAIDGDTVQLTFDRPFVGWVGLLSGAPGVLPAHVLADGGLDRWAEDLPVTGGWFRLDGVEPERRLAFVAHEQSPLGPPGLAALEVLVVPSLDTALGLLGDGTVDAVVGHVALDPGPRVEEVAGSEWAVAFGGTRLELVWDPDANADEVVRAVAAQRLDASPFVEGLLRGVGRVAGGVHPALAPLPTPSSPPPPPDDVDSAVTVQVVRTVEGFGLFGRLLQADLEAAGVATTLLRVDPPQHLAAPVASDGRLRVVRVPPDRSSAALLAEAGLDHTEGVAADAMGLPTADPMVTGVPAPGPHAAVAEALGNGGWLLPVAEVAVTHAWAPDRITGMHPSGWPGVGLWDVGAWRVP